jgi:hypothetical protein
VRSEKPSGSPEEWISRIMQLISEANVKRITVKQGGRVILDIPLSVGIVGALLSPGFVAMAMFGAILTSCVIEIEQA